MKSCRLLHCVRRRALTGCLWFQHSTNHCPAHCFPSAPALEFKSLHLIIKGKLPFCVMPSAEITAVLSGASGALSEKTCPVFRLLTAHSRPSQVHLGLDFGSRKPSLCCRTCCQDGIFYSCTTQPSNPNHCWWRSSWRTAGVVEGRHFKFELI